jgi:phosphatidylglycerophosphate synthase
MNTLILFHARLLITILLFFGALTLWGFFSYLRGQAISGSYRGALAIGELLMLAQFVLGLILLIGGRHPAREAIHILYGLVAILTLPGTFAYTRGRDSRYEQLIYAIACLFLCGIALRALETGQVPGT